MSGSKPKALLVGLCLFAQASLGGAEEVLLLLPKNFDVQPIGGWSRHSGQTTEFTAKDLKGEPVLFRFRGEEMTQTFARTDHHNTGDCWVDIDYQHEYRATFRRGVLKGRWTSDAHNFYRSCKERDDGEYMRVHDEGVVTGQADADGRLKLAVQVTDMAILDRRMEWVGQGKTGRFRMFDEWKKRDQALDAWSFGFEFQLPVGELQSSQRTSAPPPPASRPAQDRRPPDAETGSAGVGDRETETAQPGEDVKRTKAVGAPSANDARAPDDDGTHVTPATTGPQDPTENEPATPAETAAATLGSGLLAGLGAWLFARANGAGLGDLLGGLGRVLGTQASADPPELRRIDEQEPQGAEADVPVAPPPDAMGEVASEIAAADARIESRRQRIAERQAEIERDEAEIRQQEEALGLDPLGLTLQERFNEYQGELSREGYRVINPGYDQALPVREVVDAGALIAAQLTPGVKPVRCGDFAALGVKDLEADLRARYGDDADRFIVDRVFVDVARDDSWSGQANAFLDAWVAPKNHVATRVITPDGRRFILDYWEAGRGSGRQMVSEEAWVERWRGRLGDDMKYHGSDDNEADENLLVNQVDLLRSKKGATTEQAIDLFRDMQQKHIQEAPCDVAEKARRLKRLETQCRSYERCGAFRSRGTGAVE